MDLVQNLALGFSVVNQIAWYNLDLFGAVYSVPVPINIFLCLVGALDGMVREAAGQ